MAHKQAQLAGTFWTDHNLDSVFTHLLSARSLLEDQTQADLHDLNACLSRNTTPIHRRVLVDALKLNRLDIVDGMQKGWPLPPKLRNIPMITDRINTPTRVWLNNIDYFVKDGYIYFSVDPYTEVDDFEYLYDEQGNVKDAVLTLWISGAEYDEGYLADMWGAAVGVIAPSSEEYRTLLCVIYDALIGGTSRKHVEQVVSLFNGAPLVIEDETVVESAKDSKGLFLATDKHIYRAAKSGLPIVAVGEHVKAGDPLFDTCRFGRGIEPAELVLPKSFLETSIGGDLTFQNREVPLTISDGHVEFEVGGQPDAVKRFWTLFNSRITSEGLHLHELLAGQTTINPCKFVLKNVLRANCLLYAQHAGVKPDSFAGIDQKRLLRLIVPPHEALLIAQ